MKILQVLQLLKMYWPVFPLVFLAGLIDAIAGGGGLISLPAYMIAGLPLCRQPCLRYLVRLQAHGRAPV